MIQQIITTKAVKIIQTFVGNNIVVQSKCCKTFRWLYYKEIQTVISGSKEQMTFKVIGCQRGFDQVTLVSVWPKLQYLIFVHSSIT